MPGAGEQLGSQRGLGGDRTGGPAVRWQVVGLGGGRGAGGCIWDFQTLQEEGTRWWDMKTRNRRANHDP